MVYMAVGLAGVVGALLRYYIGLAVQAGWDVPFPLGTLVVNGIGCFAVGWMTTAPYARRIPEMVRQSIGTGLIGSFTTFSAFSVETVELVQAQRWGAAIGYMLDSLWGGLLLAWIGMRVGSFKVR